MVTIGLLSVSFGERRMIVYPSSILTDTQSRTIYSPNCPYMQVALLLNQFKQLLRSLQFHPLALSQSIRWTAAGGGRHADEMGFMGECCRYFAVQDID
jgi:hypothetical protein